MNDDLKRILESKRAMRGRLAALPVAEKLRMLDVLRERLVAIRGSARPAAPGSGAGIAHEPPAALYGQENPSALPGLPETKE